MKLLEFLSLETGASIETLRKITFSAPRRYKVYQIPKRSGGMRTIAHPAQELKALQRIILHNILDSVPVSPIAMAYVSGRGILENARVHATQRWILKLDFRNFFPSIVPEDWDRIVRRRPEFKGFSASKSDFHKLLFWGAGEREPRCLSIGAPTSPSVSNLACEKLDEWMLQRAKHKGLLITRYADDVTISGDDPALLVHFENDLRSTLEKSRGPNLQLNDAKRGLYGPGQRKMVTGLIVTPDGHISIGRERKREIHSLVHKFTLGQLDEASTMKAKGLLAFAIMAEKEFFERLVEKYGSSQISDILKFRVEAPEIDMD